jgi:hypothetical protein
MELAEMMTQYVNTNYLDIKNFPVSLTLGEDYSSGASVQEPMQTQPQAQVQTPQAQAQTQPQSQPQEQGAQGAQGVQSAPQGQNTQAQATAAQVPAKETQEI